MKRWQSLLLGLIVSVATLAFALRGVDIKQLGDEFAHGNYLFLVPALALIVLGLVLRAIRWRILLNNRIQIVHSFHILNVSYFLNSVLPLRLGEVARGFLATRVQPPIAMFTSLSSVVVERLSDLLAVVVLIALALPTASVTPVIEQGAKISGVIAIVGTLVLAIFAARPALAHRVLDLGLRIMPFLERLHPRELVDRILDGIAPLGSIRTAVPIFLWTGLSWLSSVVATYILMYVFYDKPQLNAALLMTSIASLAIAVPAVPGSIGPFEAAMVTGLTLAGMVASSDPQQQARAAACSVLIHIITTGSYVLLGVIGLGQEKISLGEVMRSARQIGSRSKTAESSEAAPTAGEQSN